MAWRHKDRRRNKKGEAVMKKKILIGLVTGLLALGVSISANATTLTFDTPVTPGIILGGGMLWHGVGGGHLYNEWWNNDDMIIFDFTQSTYVNDFQMNAMPWEGYNGGNIGYIDIAALNNFGDTIWSTTADLTGYTNWDDWLTISVETDNVAQLYFAAPGIAPHYNGFWPSVDNLRINENASVPEPATMILFGAGLAGLAGNRIRKKKK